MTLTRVPGDRPEETGPAHPVEPPTYQGSRFPWWLTLLYLAFALWGFVYMFRFYLPDLKAWLTR